MKKLFFPLLGILATSLFCFAQQKSQSASFDRVIDSLYKPSEPGGVALLAQHGAILYQRAFGMANLELNVKMQYDMVFEIGSMTKQFTAVCILQLMEQGKLSVADPINKYIPDCPPAWQPVTVENLLSHTSGISDQPGQQSALHDIEKIYRSLPLAFAPGTKWVYANIDFVLLGYIIESVSKMPYQEYLKKNILQPVDMTHTWYGSNEAIIPNRVPGYIKNKKGNFQNSYMFIAPSASGALLSTTSDLLKWNQALVNGSLIKKETLDKAWSSYHLSDGQSTRYGYGWQTGGEIQGSKIVEHGGVAVGYLTDAIYLPKEDIYVVVLTNQRGISAEMVAGQLAAIAINKPFPAQEINLPDDTLKHYDGVYKPDNDTVNRHITLSDHKLYYQRIGGPKMQMKPYAPDHFFFDNTTVIGEFKRDAQKRIISLLLFNNRYPDKPTDEMKKR